MSGTGKKPDEVDGARDKPVLVLLRLCCDVGLFLLGGPNFLRLLLLHSKDTSPIISSFPSKSLRNHFFTVQLYPAVYLEDPKSSPFNAASPAFCDSSRVLNRDKACGAFGSTTGVEAFSTITPLAPIEIEGTGIAFVVFKLKRLNLLRRPAGVGVAGAFGLAGFAEEVAIVDD